MKKQIEAIDFSGIEKAIVSVKGQNVIIDSDVASIYGVETREVNQAIKNNPDKFPAGYIVEADKNELIKNFDKFKNLKHSTERKVACHLFVYKIPVFGFFLKDSHKEQEGNLRPSVSVEVHEEDKDTKGGEGSGIVVCNLIVKLSSSDCLQQPSFFLFVFFSSFVLFV